MLSSQETSDVMEDQNTNSSRNQLIERGLNNRQHKLIALLLIAGLILLGIIILMTTR
jgi:hypothetical protein